MLVEVENCGPFGCTKSTRVDTDAMAKLKKERPLGHFAGLASYTNRNHLAFAEIADIVRTASGPADIAAQVSNLPFYKALSFTLTYCLLVTPIAMARFMRQRWRASRCLTPIAEKTKRISSTAPNSAMLPKKK